MVQWGFARAPTKGHESELTDPPGKEKEAGSFWLQGNVREWCLEDETRGQGSGGDSAGR